MGSSGTPRLTLSGCRHGQMSAGKQASEDEKGIHNYCGEQDEAEEEQKMKENDEAVRMITKYEREQNEVLVHCLPIRPTPCLPPKNLSPSSAAADSRSCKHLCDLSHGCCACIVRVPLSRTIQGLEFWWKRHGLTLPRDDFPRLHAWRFYCASCAESFLSSNVSAGECLPLPFGGILACTLDNQAVMKEIVRAVSVRGEPID